MLDLRRILDVIKEAAASGTDAYGLAVKVAAEADIVSSARIAELEARIAELEAAAVEVT